MDAAQYLFYGFGQVAYAIAMADGKVQKEEEKKLIEIVEKQLAPHWGDADYAEIIFQVLEHDHLTDAEWFMNEGLKNMKLGRIKLTPELKQAFMQTAVAIAEAFPPFSEKENKFVERFKKEIEQW
ncbi:MAG: hypothetical protein D6707_01925 [Bacteroidetes bacterium]|nr:MAG: hypothetical protein D6707_01925 [Bacteroidota bacterium]